VRPKARHGRLTVLACLWAAACGRAPGGVGPAPARANDVSEVGEVGAVNEAGVTDAPPLVAASAPRREERRAPDAAQPALAFSGGDGGRRTRVYRLAAIGDSLTDAHSKGGAFLELLHERCPRSTFDNLGVGGQMVNQMAARFSRQVLGQAGASNSNAPSYSDVLVWGGVNDLYSDQTAGRTVAKIQKDLAFMYSAARARGVRVLAMTVAPWGGFTRYWSPKRRGDTLALNAWIRDGSARGDVSGVVDAWALLSCRPPDDPDKLCPAFARRDGLHITTDGQRKLGQELHARYFADCE